MPQRYKLRLGDGTVVSVDADGLKTWVGDRRAMAQAVGTPHWRPLRDVIAEEEAAERLSRALVPPKPRGEPATPPPPASPPREPSSFEPPAFEPPSFEPPSFDPAPPAAPPPSPLPSDIDLSAEAEPFVPTPLVQTFADDPSPVTSPPQDQGPQEDVADMPVIPMKPLDDERRPQTTWQGEPQEFRSAWDEIDEDEEDDYDDRRGQLDGPLLRALQVVGGFLSRCLNRLSPFADQWLEQRRSAAEAKERHAPPPRPTAVASARPELLTLADDPEPDRSTPLARVSGWLGGLGAALRGPASEEPAPQAPRPKPVELPRALPVEKPHQPPTPIAELPVLKLRESREPREREDVYEGGGAGLSIDLGPLWSVVKRVVLWGAVVAAGYYAWTERDVWLPRAARAGQATFTQIDRLVLSRERAAEHDRAFAAAAERLPGLDRRTIELVFSRSATGIMEAPEVFQLAREAAERGLSALPPAEADELRALQAELLAVLGPAERRLISEYDQTRARRPLFPFENPQVMELVGRGALALPLERRERLRELTHRAVVAGIEPPAAASTPPGDTP